MVEAEALTMFKISCEDGTGGKRWLKVSCGSKDMGWRMGRGMGREWRRGLSVVGVKKGVWANGNRFKLRGFFQKLDGKGETQITAIDVKAKATLDLTSPVVLLAGHCEGNGEGVTTGCWAQGVKRHWSSVQLLRWRVESSDLNEVPG